MSPLKSLHKERSPTIIHRYAHSNILTRTLLTILFNDSPHRRYGIVVMAVSCASLFQPTAVNAYSFVSSSHRTNLQNSHSKASSNFGLPSSPTLRRQTSASLVMKRPNRIRRPTDKDRSNTQLTQAEELPANLKRKVVAARPTLGHVVPKKSTTRQHKPLSELQSSSQQGGSNTAQLRPQGQSRDTGRYNNASNLRVLGGSVRGRKLDEV